MLEGKKLSFRYKKQPPVFENVSFSLPEGEVLSIMGPNGAGKSTLLKCINRIHRPASGSIAFDGTDVYRMSRREIGRLFGCRIVETTEAKVFEGAGASGADVASVIVLGQYAYGYTSFKGAKPRVIVKPAGSAGTSDPLDQLSTVGWKMDGFGVKMLQPEYAVMIECGFTA